MTETKKRPRGFAAMDRERVREIASKGGKAVHAAGTGHQFSSDEARVAGRKGGLAPRRARTRRTDDGTYPNVEEERAKTEERAKASEA